MPNVPCKTREGFIGQFGDICASCDHAKACPLYTDGITVRCAIAKLLASRPQYYTSSMSLYSAPEIPDKVAVTKWVDVHTSGADLCRSAAEDYLFYGVRRMFSKESVPSKPPSHAIICRALLKDMQQEAVKNGAGLSARVGENIILYERELMSCSSVDFAAVQTPLKKQSSGVAIPGVLPDVPEDRRAIELLLASYRVLRSCHFCDSELMKVANLYGPDDFVHFALRSRWLVKIRAANASHTFQKGELIIDFGADYVTTTDHVLVWSSSDLASQPTKFRLSDIQETKTKDVLVRFGVVVITSSSSDFVKTGADLTGFYYTGRNRLLEAKRTSQAFCQRRCGDEGSEELS